MDRRQFFKTGAKVAAAGAVVSLPTQSGLAAEASSVKTPPVDPGNVDCNEGLHYRGPPAATAQYRHLHEADSQVHAEASRHGLSARPVLL